MDVANQRAGTWVSCAGGCENGALPELEAEMRAALAHMPAQRFTGAWAATEAHADFSELGALRGQFVPVSAHELIGC